MPNIPEIEQQLKAVYDRDFEFVEPYEGKHGRHPAEIFIEPGTGLINPIWNTCRKIGIKDEELIVDHGGYRGPYIQLIFKNHDAVSKFKQRLQDDYNNVIASKREYSRFKM